MKTATVNAPWTEEEAAKAIEFVEDCGWYYYKYVVTLKNGHQYPLVSREIIEDRPSGHISTTGHFAQYLPATRQWEIWRRYPVFNDLRDYHPIASVPNAGYDNAGALMVATVIDEIERGIERRNERRARMVSAV